jgi:RimJ/RimL family protein N-acetyltransferase
MNIEQFAPDANSEAVRACYQIYLATLPFDDPDVPAMSPRCFAGWLALGWTEDPRETWLARDAAGEPVGMCVLSMPHRENRHLAEVIPTVHPARRRAGLGTELLRHAAERAHQAGRAALNGTSRDGAPGSAFARACGARQGLTEVRRILRLNDIPPGHLSRLRAQAEAAAAGYELRSWVGPAPEDLYPALAAIYGDAEDMPRDTGHEPWHWDIGRVRQDERRQAALGLRSYMVIAQSLTTGELAGLTQLAIDPPVPTWGFQELTAVARAHRGHRLGLLVKVAMLDLLAEREPQLTHILTGNADANEHMIAINAALGFQVLEHWPSWELEVAQVLARPAATGHSLPAR